MSYFGSYFGYQALGCGSDCGCPACRMASPTLGCRCHTPLSGLGERYFEDDDDDERPPRPPPGPGRMRTGVAGLGYYGGLSQGPYVLQRPMQPQEPSWRSRIRLAPQMTLQMPPYETVEGFYSNQWRLTAAQLARVQSTAQRIAATWQTTSPVTSLRFSGFMLNSETVSRLDAMRGIAVREALVTALRAIDPNLPGRIRWEPDEPRGVTGYAPRVEIFAWMGLTPPPARTPQPRIPPVSDITPGTIPGISPETPEKRINPLLRPLPPVPPQRGRSFTQWFWNEFDTRINAAMRRAGVPASLQPYLRSGARAAIERGAEAIFNHVLDAAE